MPDAVTSGAILTIDLDAVQANYRTLQARAAGAECSAVVKADAYGLGAEQVAPALWQVGCRTFFVAHIDEGIRLRAALAAASMDADIHVLNGALAGTEPVFEAHRLIPVLNSPEAVLRMREHAARTGRSQPADLHLDTGMARLGLAPAEARAMAGDTALIAGLDIRLVISHLACADEPDHPLNREQLAAFRTLRTLWPQGRAALANSSGIFLGPDYCFDLVRPGAALYGVSPTPGGANPMAAVVALHGKILQVRDVDTNQSVGYGASHRFSGKARVATVAVGYADGFPRTLSNCGWAYVGDVRVAIVGRVSMDLITLDVTQVPPGALAAGAHAEFIGPHTPVDTVAEAAGTIGYEILTRLGRRYHRAYLGGAANAAGRDAGA